MCWAGPVDHCEASIQDAAFAPVRRMTAELTRSAALFQLDESDLEDLENERRVDVEIAREMRARESSEGDEFLASEGDEL